jgi:hypothetical protein
MASCRNIRTIIRQKHEPDLIEDQFNEPDLNKDFSQMFIFKYIPTVFRTTTKKDIFITRFNISNECGNFDAVYDFSLRGKGLVSSSLCTNTPLIKIIAAPGDKGSNICTFTEFNFSQPLPILLLRNDVFIDVEINNVKEPLFIRFTCAHYKNDIAQILSSTPIVCPCSKDFQIRVINHSIITDKPCVRKENGKSSIPADADDDEYEPTEGEPEIPQITSTPGPSSRSEPNKTKNKKKLSEFVEYDEGEEGSGDFVTLGDINK